MQPAVSPAQERRGSQYYSGVDSEAPPFYQSGFRNSSRSGSANNSRPSSRPGSVHGALPNLTRFTSIDDREDMHTPLEDVEEYEPLFPEEKEAKGQRPIPAAERFKRREMKRFPSQDIWEDTPNSLQLQATVNTPEPTDAPTANIPKSTTTSFETPEAEKARKGEVPEDDKAKLIPKEERLVKSHFKPHLRDEMHRPGMKQRFPSRDIWEDSPDSARLETTVAGPQNEAPASLVEPSVEDEGLRAGAVVSTSGRPDVGIIGEEQARDGSTAGAAAVAAPTPSIPPRPAKNKLSMEAGEPAEQSTPTVPARPPKRLHKVPPADAGVPIAPSKASAGASPVDKKEPSPTESRKPALPERSKPEIPPRPMNPIARDSSESVPLSKVTSAASAGSVEEETRGPRSPPPAPKPKPAIPSRPAGSKIAALKAGFLSDLDKRLQLGPQGTKPQEKAPEEPENEAEKALLADARKGRARGPARRKPAASPAAAEAATAGTEAKPDLTKWAIQEPRPIWTVQEDGQVILQPVGSSCPTAPEPTPLKAYSDAIKNSMSAMATENAKQLEASHPGPLATLAKESSMSKEPVSLDQATATKDAYTVNPRADLATETSTSNEVNTPTSSKSSDLPPVPSAVSQTGEQNITTNPGTDEEEKVTAIIGGDAQAEGGGNVLVREGEPKV